MELWFSVRAISMLVKCQIPSGTTGLDICQSVYVGV